MAENIIPLFYKQVLPNGRKCNTPYLGGTPKQKHLQMEIILKERVVYFGTYPFLFYSKTYNYLDALKRRGYNPRQRRWGRCPLTNCPHIFGFYYNGGRRLAVSCQLSVVSYQLSER